MPRLFDPDLRAARRDRAARSGPALFLLARAFDDCIERIAMMGRRFDDALLVGCPDPAWPKRLEGVAEGIRVFDPGPLFAAAGGGTTGSEERIDVEPESLDLILAIGTLDTLDDLPQALLRLQLALKPDGLLMGAVSGGETLPRLRQAMRAADSIRGIAAPRIHPRIEAAALAPLLERAGLARPVVDIDRVAVRYSSFDRLVGDLRAMAATNCLVERPRTGLDRAQAEAARRAFESDPVETFEIIHFAAWKGGNRGWRSVNPDPAQVIDPTCLRSFSVEQDQRRVA